MPFQMASPEVVPDTDTAEEADLYEFTVQPGDVIVVGSDGLFDNMWNHELAAMVQTGLR